MLGALVIALGYGASMLLLGSAWGLMVVSSICSTGFGLAYGAMLALIMGVVPKSETGSANSFNTLMRSVGTSVSAVVVGVVLVRLTVGLGSHAVPSEHAFRTGLHIGCGVALLAAAVASAIPVRRSGAVD